MTQNEKREFFTKFETMMNAQIEATRQRGRELLTKYVEDYTRDSDFVFEQFNKLPGPGDHKFTEVLDDDTEYCARANLAKEFCCLFRKLDELGWSTFSAPTEPTV